jgi:hypothetical protein
VIPAYSIKVGHFISNLFKSEIIGTVRRNITTWTNFYFPCGSLFIVYSFFSKGHNFHIQSPFLVLFFLIAYIFERFPPRPSISYFKSIFFAYLIWLLPVIFCLPVPTTSHRNLIWRMYWEVKDYNRLPWEKNKNPLMMTSMSNGLIGMMK